VEIIVEIRRTNQVTAPRAVAAGLGLQPGDRLALRLESGLDGEPEIRARRIRHSYAGALSGVYGTTDEIAAYLAEERASWNTD
jgi:hypothetical protein